MDDESIHILTRTGEDIALRQLVIGTLRLMVDKGVVTKAEVYDMIDGTATEWSDSVPDHDYTDPMVDCFQQAATRLMTQIKWFFDPD